MKLIIEGRAEEIAALAAELQGRQGSKPTAETIRDIFLERKDLRYGAAYAGTISFVDRS